MDLGTFPHPLHCMSSFVRHIMINLICCFHYNVYGSKMHLYMCIRTMYAVGLHAFVHVARKDLLGIDVHYAYCR